MQTKQSVPGPLDPTDEERPLPPRADERDRALYAKLRDYLIRVDDDVTCKICQKRFEIPSHQTMVFLDERSSRGPSGNDDDDNRGNRA